MNVRALAFATLLLLPLARPVFAQNVPSEPDPAPEAVAAPVVPAERLLADPLKTRGTVMTSLRLTTWKTAVPLPGIPSELNGDAPAIFFSTDLYGRRLGFDLSYRLLNTERVAANGDALQNTKALFVEVQPDFNVVLMNRQPLFVSAGMGLNARLNVVDLDESFSRSVASWHTVVGGVDARARIYLGRYAYATGSVFVGFLPITGQWQSAGVTTFDISGQPDGPPPTGSPQPYFESGSLSKFATVNGLAAVSVRPLEWIAANAGLAVRTASFQVDGRGPAQETDFQPFVGVDFLY